MSRRTWGLVLAVLALAGFFAAVALGHSSGSSVTYVCNGPEVQILNNSNGSAVDNGGVPPSFSTGGKTYCLTYLEHYHWNDGNGAQGAGQTIGVRRAGGASGSFRASISAAVKTSSGQNNAPNVNWYAYVPRVPQSLINGTYTCTDSGSASWSSNKESGHNGFCIVRGALATRETTTSGATSTGPTTTTPPPTEPCKCSGISVHIDGALFKNAKLRSDQQDFGVGFIWTMGCTRGAGGCKATITFQPATVLAGSLPKPPPGLKLDIHAKTILCQAACNKSVSGKFQIKMHSTRQLNQLFGRAFAYSVIAKCAGVTRQINIKVTVDRHGVMRAGKPIVHILGK